MSRYESKLQHQQNESLNVAIGPNENVLSDRKLTHTHSHHRVAQAMWRENYTVSIIAIVIRISRSNSAYARVDS